MARVSRTRKRISAILFLAGLVCIGIWVWSLVRGALYQREASRQFEEQTRNAPQRPSTVPPVVPPEPRPGTVIGRLEIPRLHLSAMVREGTDSHTLGIALGHVRGTAMPGAPGNVGVAGHRDTLFRCLRNITKDDRIVFQTTYGDYTYQVDTTKIVKPTDVAVLAPAAHSEITLVTCYPFYYVGAAPDRFVVHARLLSAQVAEQKFPQSPSRLLAKRTPPRAPSRLIAKSRRARAASRWAAERRPARRPWFYDSSY